MERGIRKGKIRYSIDYYEDAQGFRKSPYLYVFWCEGRRTFRLSTGTESWEEAQDFLAYFILERENKGKQPRKLVKLKMIFEQYMTEHGPRIVNMKRAKLSRAKIEKFFGTELYVSDINRASIRDYIADRETAGVKPSTINRELTFLRASLRHAVREERLESSPYIEILQEPPPRDRWLTAYDAGLLYRAFVDDVHKLFVDIALRTGARPGAIKDLKLSQIDLEGRLIHFHPDGMVVSTKRRPTVPISNDLFPMLVKEMERPGRKSDYLIETKYGQIKGDLSPVFKRASARAGIARVNPYVLRHTVATWLHQEGHSTDRIGRLLGHSGGRTTDRYIHHHPNHLRDLVNTLDIQCAQLARGKPKTTTFYGRERKRGKL